jgi:hypothetical protein
MWQGLPGRELEIDMTTTSSSLEEACFKEIMDYSEDGNDHMIVHLLLIFNAKAKGGQNPRDRQESISGTLLRPTKGVKRQYY